MEVYAARNGDYLFHATHEELTSLRASNSHLETKLILEGGQVTQKVAKLRFDNTTKDLLTLRLDPPNSGWDDILSIEMTFNEKAYQKFMFEGPVVQGNTSIDIYLLEYHPNFKKV